MADFMNFHYMFVYAAVNCFCIVSSLIILSKFSYNIGSDYEIQTFRHMTACYLAFVLLELIWCLAVGGVIKLTPLTTGIIKVASTLFIPLMVYFWFWFAETRFKVKFKNFSQMKVLTYIPMVLLMLFYLSSFVTGMVFKITPERTVEPGPLIGLTGVVDNIYGLAIIFHALILWRKERASYKKKEYLTQIVFIVICTVAGMIDAIVSNTPLMPLAIALAFIFLFSNLQEGQIYNDALTGVNNRRKADQYLEEVHSNASAENAYYLFMLDINYFKRINDRFGHLEGDRALQLVAGALQKAANEFEGFAARWGGDEFVVIIKEKKLAAPEDLAEKVAEHLDEIMVSEGLLYSLAMSIGYVRCDQSSEDLAQLIGIADERMYQDKQKNYGLYTRRAS